MSSEMRHSAVILDYLNNVVNFGKYDTQSKAFAKSQRIPPA
jgi:hypothetical protein